MGIQPQRTIPYSLPTMSKTQDHCRFQISCGRVSMTSTHKDPLLEPEARGVRTSCEGFRVHKVYIGFGVRLHPLPNRLPPKKCSHGARAHSLVLGLSRRCI